MARKTFQDAHKVAGGDRFADPTYLVPLADDLWLELLSAGEEDERDTPSAQFAGDLKSRSILKSYVYYSAVRLTTGKPCQRVAASGEWASYFEPVIRESGGKVHADHRLIFHDEHLTT